MLLSLRRFDTSDTTDAQSPTSPFLSLLPTPIVPPFTRASCVLPTPTLLVPPRHLFPSRTFPSPLTYKLKRGSVGKSSSRRIKKISNPSYIRWPRVVPSPLSITLFSPSEVDEKRTRVPQLSLMENRLASLFPLLPLALLLLLAASSPPIAAAKDGIKDDVPCSMCSSCDNPCQPAASSPPPPPSSSAECPPPPSSSGGIFYYSPPPPSSSGGIPSHSPPPPYVYSSPPPPSSGGGSGGGGSYYYPPPSNKYYPAPPPPNPFLPYFPFYYYSPPPPSKYYSGSLSLKPLSSIPLLLLFLLCFV